MSRFFIEPNQFHKDQVHFSREEARHIRKVLRLKDGAVVRVFNGNGQEYEVKLVSGPNMLKGVILQQVSAVREPNLKITLAQGIAKGEKNELVIQKATEIGIWSFIPLLCERSVVKLQTGHEKTSRWQRVATEAAKQCGRATIPEIQGACSITTLATRFKKYDAVFLLWEKEKAQSFKSILQSLRREASIETLLVLVGPEGGLTDSEAQIAILHGACAVTLGPRILRTETAGLVALSALFYEFDELQS